MKLQSTEIRDDNIVFIAHLKPALEEDVLRVVQASESDIDGRSQWLWATLPNGDVMLCTFPQGDLFDGLLQAGKLS